MQIAENLAPNGATTGEKFNAKLTEFIAENGFKKVIETGTLYGTGTTRAILNGLSGDFRFITIENNPEHFQAAKRNLGKITGLQMMNGLSIGRSQIPINITEDFPEFVVTDHQPKNRLQLYLKELSFNDVDNVLNTALSVMDFQPDFVLLDSCGLIGYIEFRYLMERVNGSFYLALDDTYHRKHFDTMQYIKQHPEQFEIIWEIMPSHYSAPGSNGYDREKFGSAIIKYNHGV